MGQSRMLRVDNLESQFLDGHRTVRISLPASYQRNSRRRYPVLYVHDGQNVLSNAGPDCCFGWGSWQLDLIADRLADAEKMSEIIIVAIDNDHAHRYEEYCGPVCEEKSGRKRHHGSGHDGTRFDRYGSFLIKELKPHIDKTYRTRPAARNTGLLGASLGGICSLAVAWQYPRVFGLAASISGSFQIEDAAFLEQVLHRYRGKPKPVRIYLDSGTVDRGGDDDGLEITGKVVAELTRVGWKPGRNLQHYIDPRPYTEAELEKAGLRHDKWAEARESQHNEFYWRQRLWRPLTFLYPPNG